jgi:hypothetical protein
LKESVDSELKIERRLLFPGVDNLLVGAEAYNSSILNKTIKTLTKSIKSSFKK